MSFIKDNIYYSFFQDALSSTSIILFYFDTSLSTPFLRQFSTSPLSNVIDNFSNIIVENSQPEALKEVLDFYNIKQTLQDLDLWIENKQEVLISEWITSTPEVKLFYPEPFIASPSFNHEEIWFIHILHYNY